MSRTRGKGADATAPMVLMGRGVCPRRLKPGQAKRYTHEGPLVGFYVGCPACGFVESHTDLNGEHGFTEEGGLTAARGWRCMLCERSVTVALGVLTAVLDPLPPPS